MGYSLEELQKSMQEAIWVAKALFDRGKASGSSANISFRLNEHVFISGTNTCFGNLTENSFAKLDLGGNHLEGIKPSKEFPLHLALYKQNSKNQAVIHTHSLYSTLWSCLYFEEWNDIIPKYTPYLDMKLGAVKLIDYYSPGSKELFTEFEKEVDDRQGYLLKNHGPIVSDQTILKAFYSIEELEESASIAWQFANSNLKGEQIK